MITEAFKNHKDKTVQDHTQQEEAGNMGKDHSQLKCSWITKLYHSSNKNKSSQKCGEGEVENHRRKERYSRRITARTSNMRDHRKRGHVL